MRKPLGTSRLLRGWRRIAGAMWSNPDDPQIFGALDVDARPLLAFLQRARLAGHHVTATHLVGRAIAHAFSEVPELNVQIRNGRSRQRDAIDVFFITAVSGGSDLSGVKVEQVERKSVVEVAGELAKRSHAIRRGEDLEFARTKRLTDRVPPWLLRPMLRATAFLTQRLQLELPRLGLHASPFGSAMVSSVGMLGIPRGFAPLAWLYDVPLLLLVGEIAEQPVAVDGRVEARPMLPISATIDHRYVDGWQIANTMRAFREYLGDPARFEPSLTIVPTHARAN